MPEKMADQPIKFGVLGCANVGRKVSRAINLSPNSTLSAIGSRSLEKATKFAKENGFPESAKIYGSYDAVLNDPDVEAVYIPLPTRLHVQWAVLAAQKKKHLLLEKPVAVDVKEVDIILEACESNGVQYMDATMWMHHPRTTAMRDFLSNPQQFGELKSVNSCFTFAAKQDFHENNIRVQPDLDPLGALGDVGWYCIRAILWASDFELPKTVVALRGPVFNEAGVILACSASLHWEDGKLATFHCSFLANMTTDVTVFGTNGTLQLRDFVIPFEENKASFFMSADSSFDDLMTGWGPKPSEHHVKTDHPQEVYMVSEFSRLVGSIKFDGSKPEMKWPSWSRKTQQVIDAVKFSIERGFEAVEL